MDIRRDYYLLWLMLVYLTIIVVSLGAHFALFVSRRCYMPRRRKKEKRWMNFLKENGRDAILSEHQIRMLRNDIELAAWSDALFQYKEEGGDYCLFIKRNAEQLSRLGILIKREVIRAYYAYIITRINADGKIQSKELKALMKVYLQDGHSVYLRENALKAIYSFREPAGIVQAWLILSKRGLYHDSKLLGNDLTDFPGDIRLLTTLLMSRYSDLEENFKIALINTLRQHKIVTFNKRLELELYKKSVSIDIKCCVIRLLGVDAGNYVQVLTEMLATYMNHEDWEPAAVAAIALKSAPSQQGRQYLFEALTSRYWHVRKNVALTLAHYGVTEEEKNSVMNGSDRYAADALSWALSQ